MPKLATARARTARGGKRPASQPRGELVTIPMGAKPVPAEEKPVRGVKLKTVSTFTLLFALLCLAALAAGRPPASAGDRGSGAPARTTQGAKGAAPVSGSADRPMRRQGP